jgi:Ran GTPase-activating protein (RanGAP) involved in mRNA processing and transport
MNFQSSKKAANRPGQIIQRTVGIFKSLVVLGITDCHMSKQSIELLADTCELLRDTLTDLDLSYSYLGLYGLKTIKQILTDPESQLINLNLKGNVLCEQGALGVSESLKKNKTLTYLNLSSNEIPISAIRTMLNHLAKSSTLFEVDLRRNDFTIDDIDDIEYKLKDNGSIVNFVFDKINRQDSFLMSLLEVDPKFYCLPQLVGTSSFFLFC